VEVYQLGTAETAQGASVNRSGREFLPPGTPTLLLNVVLTNISDHALALVPSDAERLYSAGDPMTSWLVEDDTAAEAILTSMGFTLTSGDWSPPSDPWVMDTHAVLPGESIAQAGSYLRWPASTHSLMASFAYFHDPYFVNDPPSSTISEGRRLFDSLTPATLTFDVTLQG
jgi:hypothetical protein